MLDAVSAHRWDPISLPEVVALFAAAPFRWWVSGGHALELHTERSWRDHEDVDVGVVRIDLAAVFDWLSTWELAVAATGRLTPWQGEALAAELAQNNVWVRRPGTDAWAFDLTIGDGTGNRWIYRRDPALALPWDVAVLRSGTGIPYLAPELQLLFKSRFPRRAKDDEDALEVIPLLGEAQRTLLRSRLPEDHPWRDMLGSG